MVGVVCVGDPWAFIELRLIDGTGADAPCARAEVGDTVFFVDLTRGDRVGADELMVVVFKDCGDTVLLKQRAPVLLDFLAVRLCVHAVGWAVVAYEKVGHLVAGFERCFEKTDLVGDVSGVSGVEQDEGEPVAEIQDVGGAFLIREIEDSVEFTGFFRTVGVSRIETAVAYLVVANHDDLGH